MHDEIMRLAERAAEMLDMFEQALVQYAPISDIERWPYHPEITDTAEQLRALARNGEEDVAINASDNADYIDHCAGKLRRLGYRVTADVLSAIAIGHRQLEAECLARTDHVEDRLGMVAEGWRNRIVAIERNSEYDTDLRTDTPILILRFASVSLRESANPLAKGWVDRGLVAAALAQPADADADGGK